MVREKTRTASPTGLTVAILMHTIHILIGIASPLEKGKGDVSANLCVFRMWPLSWSIAKAVLFNVVLLVIHRKHTEGD